MLPCHGCAYRESIAGSAHTRCAFKWAIDETRPAGNPHGIRHEWYIFPLNYDPTWGPDDCAHRSDTRDSASVATLSPLQELLSLLGGKRL